MADYEVAARLYCETLPNKVTMMTSFFDDEIRYSVVKDGRIIYNKALEGRYSLKVAQRLAREQEEAARKASNG